MKVTTLITLLLITLTTYSQQRSRTYWDQTKTTITPVTPIQVNSKNARKGNLLDTVEVITVGGHLSLSDTTPTTATANPSLYRTWKVEYRYDTIPVYILVGYDQCPDDKVTCGTGYTVPYNYTVRAYTVNRYQTGDIRTFEYDDNPIAILNENKKYRIDNDPHYIIWNIAPRKLSK